MGPCVHVWCHEASACKWTQYHSDGCTILVVPLNKACLGGLKATLPKETLLELYDLGISCRCILKAHIFLHVSASMVCVHGCLCSHVCIHISVENQIQLCVSFSITLYLTCRVRVLQGTWRSGIPASLASQLVLGIPLSANYGETTVSPCANQVFT